MQKNTMKPARGGFQKDRDARIAESQKQAEQAEQAAPVDGQAAKPAKGGK